MQWHTVVLSQQRLTGSAKVSCGLLLLRRGRRLGRGIDNQGNFATELVLWALEDFAYDLIVVHSTIKERKIPIVAVTEG